MFRKYSFFAWTLPLVIMIGCISLSVSKTVDLGYGEYQNLQLSVYKNKYQFVITNNY